MTKSKLSSWVDMHSNSAVNLSDVRQIPEEDVIISCQQKVRQVMTCCQDVVRKLESVQDHMTSDRIGVPIVPDEDKCKKSEIFLLQEKLRLSVVRINELELVEITMRKKIGDMEEKVQTLMAQLLVYKEDFDLERKDRERAHARIAELEQQLAHQRTQIGSSVVQNAHNQFPYQSFEFVSSGHDVCDIDGVPDAVELWKVVKPTETTNAAEFIDLEMEDSDQSRLPMQLVARSYDFCDFFPATSPCHPLVATPERQLSRRSELSDDGDEVTISKEPSRKDLKQVDRFQGVHVAESPVDTDRAKPDFLIPEIYPSVSSSLFSKNPEDLWNFSFRELNLDETNISASVTQSEMDASKLFCPKCRRSFSLCDHNLFLDHLEEC